MHDDDDLEDNFIDPDAWLDSDFPTATDEELQRFLKLRELRHQGALINPTLIRYPSNDPILKQVEQVIRGSVEDYQVVEQGGQWSVTAIPTGQKIYDGPGPVEVVMSRAPF